MGAAASATFVFPAVTLTSGTAGTASYAAAGLSATSVAVGVAAIAGLAIAKTALFLAAQADARGKRSATDIDFAPFFEAIPDNDDCGKLLICHSFAKADGQRTGEERAILNLFDNLSVIQPNAFGRFQCRLCRILQEPPDLCREILRLPRPCRETGKHDPGRLSTKNQIPPKFLNYLLMFVMSTVSAHFPHLSFIRYNALLTRIL